MAARRRRFCPFELQHTLNERMLFVALIERTINHERNNFTFSGRNSGGPRGRWAHPNGCIPPRSRNASNLARLGDRFRPLSPENAPRTLGVVSLEGESILYKQGASRE
jgi:hypothetical protein